MKQLNKGDIASDNNNNNNEKSSEVSKAPLYDAELFNATTKAALKAAREDQARYLTYCLIHGFSEKTSKPDQIRLKAAREYQARYLEYYLIHGFSEKTPIPALNTLEAIMKSDSSPPGLRILAQATQATRGNFSKHDISRLKTLASIGLYHRQVLLSLFVQFNAQEQAEFAKELLNLCCNSTYQEYLYHSKTNRFGGFQDKLKHPHVDWCQKFAIATLRRVAPSLNQGYFDGFLQSIRHKWMHDDENVRAVYAKVLSELVIGRYPDIEKRTSFSEESFVLKEVSFYCLNSSHVCPRKWEAKDGAFKRIVALLPVFAVETQTELRKKIISAFGEKKVLEQEKFFKEEFLIQGGEDLLIEKFVHMHDRILSPHIHTIHDRNISPAIRILTSAFGKVLFINHDKELEKLKGFEEYLRYPDSTLAKPFNISYECTHDKLTKVFTDALSRGLKKYVDPRRVEWGCPENYLTWGGDEHIDWNQPNYGDPIKDFIHALLQTAASSLAQKQNDKKSSSSYENLVGKKGMAPNSCSQDSRVAVENVKEHGDENQGANDTDPSNTDAPNLKPSFQYTGSLPTQTS